MVTSPTIPFIPKRKAKAPAQPPPVESLVLTSAFYSSEELILLLQFDRDIDISELDGSQISVNDPADNHQRYLATGSSQLISANYVQIQLDPAGSATGTQAALSAGANSGIVAVNGGGTWAGATDLSLPYP